MSRFLAPSIFSDENSTAVLTSRISVSGLKANSLKTAAGMSLNFLAVVLKRLNMVELEFTKLADVHP